MTEGFDRIIIAVPELEAARAQYRRLFGEELADTKRTSNMARAWFVLANTVLELREEAVESATIAGLVLRDRDALQEPRDVENSLGIIVEVCNGLALETVRADRVGRNSAAQAMQIAVDHVVLRTNNAQACIDFFSDEMGIRLALDKTVPEWGGRMLFFRAGKMTLEVIESVSEAASDSYFWGIAFRHPDIDCWRSELEIRGVSCSASRGGRKPGTRVASLKSHGLDIPTLLIEHLPAD